MELYDVMHTTFAARDFVDEDVPERSFAAFWGTPDSLPVAATARAGK